MPSTRLLSALASLSLLPCAVAPGMAEYTEGIMKNAAPVSALVAYAGPLHGERSRRRAFCCTGYCRRASPRRLATVSSHAHRATMLR